MLIKKKVGSTVANLLAMRMRCLDQSTGQNIYGVSQARGPPLLAVSGGVGASAAGGTPTFGGSHSGPAPGRAAYDVVRGPGYDVYAGSAYDAQRGSNYDVQSAAFYDAQRGVYYDVQSAAFYDAQRGVYYDA